MALRVIGFRLCDERKFIYKRLYSQPQRVMGFQPLRREEVFLNAVAYQQPQRVIGFRLCDEWKFVYKRLYSQPQRVRGFQKSAKADILFRMLLVKQHSKIEICFAYRQKLISVVISELYFCLSDNVRYAP